MPCQRDPWTQSWGENARYAAEAAAEGIFSLIQKYR